MGNRCRPADRPVVGGLGARDRLGRPRSPLRLAPDRCAASGLSRHRPCVDPVSGSAGQRSGPSRNSCSPIRSRPSRSWRCCCCGRVARSPPLRAARPADSSRRRSQPALWPGACLARSGSGSFPGGDIGVYALLGGGAMLAATTQGPISSLVLMMELTGQARQFALPMLVAIVVATATARTIEMRSIYEARLSDEEVVAPLGRARAERGNRSRQGAVQHMTAKRAGVMAPPTDRRLFHRRASLQPRCERASRRSTSARRTLHGRWRPLARWGDELGRKLG